MRHLPLALGLSLALAFPAMAQQTETATETPSAEASADYDATTVVARVNGREITIGHMIALLERLPDQYKNLDDAQLYPGILDQLIDQALIADSVSKMPETDSARVRLILENERLALLSKGAVDEMIAQGANEEDLQKAYDEQYGNVPAKTEYEASHILLETAEAAQEAIKMIEDGADFAEVAKEKSTGPSGPSGGSLGWFGEGVMVPPFEAAIVAMEEGAVSEPVQTQFGWHVIKLSGIREVPPPTIDEVREELSQAIIQKQIDVQIDGIRSKSLIERMKIVIPESVIRESELLDAAD